MNASTSGAPQHQRSGSVPTIVRLGHHVDDLVEGAANEVNELKFGHPSEAGERRAIGGAHNGGFSDRSIDHPLRAKVMNKAVSHFERAAVHSNVFTQTEDCGIRFHLFPEALANCFEIGRLSHKNALEIRSDAQLGRFSYAREISEFIFSSSFSQLSFPYVEPVSPAFCFRSLFVSSHLSNPEWRARLVNSVAALEQLLPMKAD